MSDKNFIGFGDGSAFGIAGHRYVFDLRDGGRRFLNEDGSFTGHTWPDSAIQKNVASGAWKYISDSKMKALFPKVSFVTITKAKPMSVKPLALKKGSLYFNTTTSQVERVIAVVDGSLIWASRHKQEAKAFPRSAFRLANQVEVDNYFNEAKAAGN